MKLKGLVLGLALVLACMTSGIVYWAAAQSPYIGATMQPAQPVPITPAPMTAGAQTAPAPMPAGAQTDSGSILILSGAASSGGKEILIDPGTTATNDNPTGRQEPAVSIEWIGPSSAKLGQPVAYQIIVKNICLIPVNQVVVRSKIPTGAKINATEPKAATEDGALVWRLETLQPHQEKRLDVQMVPEATGAIYSNATIALCAASTTRLQVYQPKLAIKATAPEKVVIGDPATVNLTVTNPGDATTEHVKIVANLSDGLEHARGKAVEFDMGDLGPKESRSVQVLCGAKVAGEQKCEASAAGEPGLITQDSVSIEVLQPKVEVAIVSPGLRYLDRHAIINLKVTNPGTATANTVTLVNQVPQGFKFVGATAEGRHDFVSRTVTWNLGDLGPGQSQEVSLDVVAINTGEFKNQAVVTAARGLKAETEAITRVEGLPALLMELVDLDDPLEVGASTSYEIRVTNTGTKTETNLQLTCEVPDKMEFLGAKGAAGLPSKVEGKEIIFEPLPKLAPRADAIYRVNVKGTAPGDLRFRAKIKADGLTEPVLKEESTKVYGDEAGSH